VRKSNRKTLERGERREQIKLRLNIKASPIKTFNGQKKVISRIPTNANVPSFLSEAI